MAGRQDYEERKQTRIDRLNEAALKASKQSTEAIMRSHNLTKDIPLGQPNIRGALTGVMNKSRAAADKSIKLADKADYYATKAEAAESNTAISSDDPNSIEKLQEKVDKLKAKQEFAKALNAYYRKNGTSKGFRDLTDERAAALDKATKEGYSWEQKPFPSYELTSINQKIKAAEKRVNQIKAVENMPAEIILHEGVCEVISDPETNRCAIKFFDRQPDEVIEKLKRSGYKWSYELQQWQRLRNQWAWRITKQIAEEIVKSASEA